MTHAGKCGKSQLSVIWVGIVSLKTAINDHDAKGSGDAADALDGLNFSSRDRLYSMAFVVLIWSLKTRAMYSGSMVSCWLRRAFW